jgi:hypothetical protein
MRCYPKKSMSSSESESESEDIGSSFPAAAAVAAPPDDDCPATVTPSPSPGKLWAFQVGHICNCDASRQAGNKARRYTGTCAHGETLFQQSIYFNFLANE